MLDGNARRRLGIDYAIPDITDRQTVYVLRPPRRRWGVKAWALVASHLAMLAGGMGIAWLALRHAL